MKKVILAILAIGSICMANRESGGRGGSSAVYIQFTSLGAGIDFKSEALYKNIVASAKSKRLVVNESIVRYGREGEVLHCVELVSPAARLEFIKALAPTILTDRRALHKARTHVLVGANCRDVRSATPQDLSVYLGTKFGI